MTIKTEFRESLKEISNEELVSLHRLHFFRVRDSQGEEQEINRIDLDECEKELLARMGGWS